MINEDPYSNLSPDCFLPSQESEKRKLEEKMKKEAILQQHQYRKAEEEIPPEMRAQFRQKQNKRGRGGDRPASIHWAGKDPKI